MGRSLHGGPVSPWPCRTRCPMCSCALILATLALGLVVTVASLVAADALGPPGLLVVSLALAISAVVLFSLRGLGPLTVAFGCGDVRCSEVASEGGDLLVAAQQQACESDHARVKEERDEHTQTGHRRTARRPAHLGGESERRAGPHLGSGQRAPMRVLLLSMRHRAHREAGEGARTPLRPRQRGRLRRGGRNSAAPRGQRRSSQSTGKWCCQRSKFSSRTRRGEGGSR